MGLSWSRMNHKSLDIEKRLGDERPLCSSMVICEAFFKGLLSTKGLSTELSLCS